MSPFPEAGRVAMQYLLGHYPVDGPVSWNDVEEIYGIAHVLNDHWVAYAIDLLEERIVVYDSLSETNNWEAVAAEFVRLIWCIFIVPKTNIQVNFHSCTSSLDSVKPSTQFPSPMTEAASRYHTI